jgi:hypothetical protein
MCGSRVLDRKCDTSREKKSAKTRYHPDNMIKRTENKNPTFR